MTKRFVVAAVSIASAAALGFALAACTDLFHGTDDLKNICELDADVSGCVDAAPAPDSAPAPDASFDLCLVDSVAAKIRAETACKWLGACETPIGRNRFAECMLGALKTYDCSIAPNRKPKGATAAYWGCLARVNSCGDVDRCIFSKPVNTCGTVGITGCDSKNEGVRDYCATTPSNARGEPCFAFGQTCYSPGGGGFCGGEREDGGCTTGCSGSQLHDCDDAGVNVGIDCTTYGAQACVSTSGVLGCKAELGTSCMATTAVTCTNGIATGCPSGVQEKVACKTLTGMSVCNPVAPGALWDVSRVCLDPAGCSASADSCSGTTISSCVGGAIYTTKCEAPFVGCSTTPLATEGAYARCVLPADAGR